jgi:hypothetical protein
VIEIAILKYLRELFSSKLNSTIIESDDGADGNCDAPRNAKFADPIYELTRNAKCADIIYELAWFAHTEMADDKSVHGSGQNRLNPTTGKIERQWFHGWYSSGKWTASLLNDVGVFESHWPYHSPLMSLEQMRYHDFSRFETPAGYTECMRALWELLGQYSWDGGGAMYEFELCQFSPDFVDRIVFADDAFKFENNMVAVYNFERLMAKVMDPWRKLSEHSEIGKVFKV